MPLSFGAPHFFLLIPLLALLGWSFRSLRLWQPLRIIILLLFVLLLADPSIRRLQRGMDLWVLIDRSSSARDIVDRDLPEWRGLLERSQPSEHDEIHYIDYADEVVTNPSNETAVYPGNRGLTRTGLAIQDALAQVKADRHSRLLVFSDGHSTEPLTGVAEKLTKMGVPLDCRILKSDELEDYQVSDFQIPSRVQLGEPFILNISVSGSADTEVPLSIYRGEKKITDTTVQITSGLGQLRLSDRVMAPGAHRYEVRIAPESDAHDGNNSFESWVEIVSGPRILLVTNYDDDPMVGILQAQGFDVIVVTDSLSLKPGQLTGTRAVILNNVPAYEIPNDFLHAIDFYVREQGGGLLMAGGNYSFGAGGYFESAIDPLLPVSMELKSEHRKLAVAMAIVMDRSGSMGMTVSSGDTKMSLAAEGAARAIELLGASDAVTLYAVDSSAHEIAPLLNVGKYRGDLSDRARRIQSMGGGIFVYNGLKAAWDVLKESELGQRHIILFSDTNDSEQPGQYKQLLKEMQAEDATVSVIGLGKRGDVDAAFLEDIAKRGAGRMFFSDVPGDLPNIFAQETVTVARSTFIEEPIGAQATGNWYELSNRDLDWLDQVGGYNLSYIREGDRAALISTDEYKAPLVAFGRRGVGRTAAVSFPLGGEFSEQTRQWAQAGDFMQTLNRWLMGESVPPGIGLRYQVDGTDLSIDLLYEDDPWSQRFAKLPPELALGIGQQRPEVRELQWERIAPGRYSARTELRDGELIRGSAKIGASAIPFGPVVLGSSREWAFDGERVKELRQTSETSGGRELLDLGDAWLKPEGREMAGIQLWLLIPLIVLFLLEALLTRTGWKLPSLKRPQRAPRQKPKKKPAAKKKQAPEPKPEPTPEPEPEPPTTTTQAERQSRYQRAKRRR